MMKNIYLWKKIISRLTVTALAVGALCGAVRPCLAQEMVASSRKQAALLSGTFRPIKTVTGLPLAVKQAFPSAEMRRDFQMADPGKPFQVTDVVMGDTLPWRRLIAAGATANGAGPRRCFLLYEKGGIAHSLHLLIFEIPTPAKPARLLWHGSGKPPRGRVSAETLRSALAHGDFYATPTPPYSA